jgi:hypothetical protein
MLPSMSAIGLFLNQPGAAKLQREKNARMIMSEVYIIECGEDAAGIVIREKRGFMFHASAQAFWSLDGQTFETPRKAQRAAETLLRDGRRPGRWRRGHFSGAVA